MLGSHRFCATLLLCVFLFVRADEHDHIYKVNDEVVLWTNTVGPYNNRQESYAYYLLPYCRGPKVSIEHYHETIGEALLGVELDLSGLEIKFKQDVKSTVFCNKTLTDEEFKAFVYAVHNNYWYQMYLDELPLYGMVGEFDVSSDPQTYKIYAHRRLEIGYNGNQIVDVNLTSNGRERLGKAANIPFSYEVIWKPSDVEFSRRFEKYLDPSFFQHRIHWFSIFNSFMMVIFLVGLVWMIFMRTLRKDYARYRKEEDMDDLDRDLGDDYGWKQVHGDVFRFPVYPMLFSSLIGTGYHIFVVAIITVLLAIIGEFYTERGSFLSAAIFVYAAVSPVNGFMGGSMYTRFGGKRWIRQMIMGALLLPSLVSVVTLGINAVAMYYHASREIPFGIMVAVLAICVFVILPLTLVGTVLGRNVKGQSNHPCRVNAILRPIPDKKWFLEPWFFVLLGGILPFGSIFIEMYFIFTSFWAYKVYYVYGFMLLVTLMLAVVTLCVTIVCTYFLLNAEDYRWRWTSFMAGASTSIYIFLYSIYYFVFKTKMYGLFQTMFYFGYMATFSIALGLMCGTIGYFGAAKFVHKIYSTVKID